MADKTFKEMADLYYKVDQAHTEASQHARHWAHEENKLGVDLINLQKELGSWLNSELPLRTIAVGEGVALVAIWEGKDKLPTVRLVKLEE